MKETHTIKSLDKLADFAREFLANLKPSESGATVIALYGDLGSGKTAFTKAVAKELGIAGEITSPTFVLEKFYDIPRKELDFDRLIHIDAYRIEENRELEVLDWNGQVKNPENLIIIEWADIVEDLIPSDAMKLEFKFVDEGVREIRV